VLIAIPEFNPTIDFNSSTDLVDESFDEEDIDWPLLSDLPKYFGQHV
jgi:hypothetical protein